MKRGVSLPLCLAVADLAQGDRPPRKRLSPLRRCLRRKRRLLNIFTWTYYVPGEVVDAFSQATGIKVNYTPFIDSNVVAKAQSSPGQFDIVVASDYVVANMIDAGLLTRLDRGRIENFMGSILTRRTPDPSPVPTPFRSSSMIRK